MKNLIYGLNIIYKTYYNKPFNNATKLYNALNAKLKHLNPLMDNLLVELSQLIKLSNITIKNKNLFIYQVKKIKDYLNENNQEQIQAKEQG